jgi:hypothetical protein
MVAMRIDKSEYHNILHDDNGRNIADTFVNDGEMTIDKVEDDNNDIREDNDEKLDAKKGDDIRGESEKPATTMRVIPPHPQLKMMT